MISLLLWGAVGCRAEDEPQGELPDPSRGGNTRYDRTDPDWRGPGRSVDDEATAAPPPGGTHEEAPGVDVGDPGHRGEGAGTGTGTGASDQDREPDGTLPGP